MNKITPEDIIKIVWGDTDRIIAGNVFIKLYKKLNNIAHKENNYSIKFPKEIIIKELRRHGIVCKDIQLIRQIVSDAFKNEIYDIRQKHLIPITDVCYTDETFARYSLVFMTKPTIIKTTNIKAKLSAIRELYKKRNYLQYYKDY